MRSGFGRHGHLKLGFQTPVRLEGLGFLSSLRERMKRPRLVTPSTTTPDIKALVTAFRCWEDPLTVGYREGRAGVSGGQLRFVKVNGVERDSGQNQIR